MDTKEKIQIMTHNIMVGLISRKINKEERDNWRQYRDDIIDEIERKLFE